MAEQGIEYGMADGSVSVLVVAIQSSGVWQGARRLTPQGESPQPFVLDGITMALQASGVAMGITAAYNPPPYSSGRVYTRLVEPLPDSLDE